MPLGVGTIVSPLGNARRCFRRHRLADGICFRKVAFYCYAGGADKARKIGWRYYFSPRVVLG